MRLSEPKRRAASINITSLIDVVFLLLLFYVVTSTFLDQPGLDLSLPEASSAEAASQKDVRLAIDADGTLSLAGRTVAVDSLEAVLRERLAASGRKEVVLEADRRVPHGRVVQAMDAARKAGATGLVVATRPEGSVEVP